MRYIRAFWSCDIYLVLWYAFVTMWYHFCIFDHVVWFFAFVTMWYDLCIFDYVVWFLNHSKLQIKIFNCQKWLKPWHKKTPNVCGGWGHIPIIRSLAAPHSTFGLMWQLNAWSMAPHTTQWFVFSHNTNVKTITKVIKASDTLCQQTTNSYPVYCALITVV